MQLIETQDAPEPAGHYSQATMVNGMVYVAGILPIVPRTEKEIPAGIIAQAKQVFRNLQAVLLAAQSDLHQLVSLQLFIPNIELWPDVNSVCEQALGPHKPARTVIPCGTLHYGALIEVNAVAIVK